MRASLQRHDGCEHSYDELVVNHPRNGLLNSDDEWQQEVAEGIDTRVRAARQKATEQRFARAA